MSTGLSSYLKLSAGQTLGALQGILAKGEAHAAATGVDEAVFLSARLFPDMFPLTRQVQIACDITARGAARLAGAPLPSTPDAETRFAELSARCKATLAGIMALDDAALDASAGRDITFPVGGTDTTMKGAAVLANFILPNLHFHAAMAYGLLRHQGVVLGKRDFMGPPPVA